MHVLKFGGSSVGSIASIKNVKQIVESRTEPVIVVVSALGGITDRLISTAQKASVGDETFRDEFQFILERHFDVVGGLLEGEQLDSIKLFLNKTLCELKDIYEGVFLIRELSPRTLCTVVSYGERISSRIIATVIKDAEHVDSIKKKKVFAKNVCDFNLTNPLVRERLSRPNPVIVLGGFISRDAETG